jgi:hypothetical protein
VLLRAWPILRSARRFRSASARGQTAKTSQSKVVLAWTLGSMPSPTCEAHTLGCVRETPVAPGIMRHVSMSMSMSMSREILHGLCERACERLRRSRKSEKGRSGEETITSEKTHAGGALSWAERGRGPAETEWCIRRTLRSQNFLAAGASTFPLSHGFALALGSQTGRPLEVKCACVSI